MKRLTKQQQIYVIKLLASFCSVSEVIEKFRIHFGKEISAQQVRYYEIDNIRSEDLRAELRELYINYRKQYLESCAEIGIYHRRYRIQELDWLYRTAKEKNNLVLAADLLERAGKETALMGTVQTTEIEEGRVARAALLKLISKGMDTEQAIAELVKLGIDEQHLRSG